ncbi:unnamed protein product [Lampetra fluviatilis]
MKRRRGVGKVLKSTALCLCLPSRTQQLKESIPAALEAFALFPEEAPKLAERQVARRAERRVARRPGNPIKERYSNE